jgi:paraquat-inducible protein B
MSKQANKTVIGGFVVGAVALVVAGVLIFGSGRFLTEKQAYVMYFRGSVKGLNAGAPVVLRGVKIGSVTNIVLRIDPADLVVTIPVFIEVEPNRFETVPVLKREPGPKEVLERLVERGLRAQLQIQSPLTGQLIVQLDFHPDTPVELVGADTEHLELPTIPSNIEALIEKIKKIPIDEIFSKVLSAVEGIDKLVNFPEVLDLIRSLNQAVKDLHKLMQKIDSRVGPVTSDFQDACKAARAALDQAEKTLSTVQNVVAENSDLSYYLNQTLEELSGAARSIRVLADYLERHPDALIRGKDRLGGK